MMDRCSFVFTVKCSCATAECLKGHPELCSPRNMSIGADTDGATEGRLEGIEWGVAGEMGEAFEEVLDWDVPDEGIIMVG